MARWGSIVEKAGRGEENTSKNTDLAPGLRIGTTLVRLQHVFLSPFVVFTVPAQVLLNQQTLVLLVVTLVGLAGMLSGRRALATIASLSLLFLLILGKAAADILKARSPDTALLLLEFMMVLFLMEASSTVFDFNENLFLVRDKDDELSRVLRERLTAWTRGQLLQQSKLTLATVGLSIGLLPVAGFTSISSNQLVFSATLVLVAVVVLLFIITQGREPESR